MLAFAGDAVAEGSFHQRVQAAGRLVEQEELGVAGQRGDQRDLLPVALGVGAGLLGRVELEAFGQVLPALGVQAAAQPAQEVDDLAAGQARPQGDVAGDVGQPAVQGHGVAPRVTAEQFGVARARAQQAEQDPQGGGLARAVRAEEGVHLTLADGQVQAVQAGARLAEQAAFLEFATREMAGRPAHSLGEAPGLASPDSLSGMRYLVRERLFSITDDFWVTDEQGDQVFYVDAKILSLRHALELKDASGRKLATIKHKLLTFTDAMEIEDDGGVVATVHKAVFSPLHHRANIDLAGGGRLEAVGNIIDKDFEIRDGGQPVARISRAWFRIRDTYGVDVAPGQDDALIICVAVCLDRIHAEEEERRR